MKHTKILKNAPEKDKTYRVEYDGSELYDAKIISYDGGCWARVRVENILPSPDEKLYKEGQEFDLKLGYYSLKELVDE